MHKTKEKQQKTLASNSQYYDLLRRNQKWSGQVVNKGSINSEK